MKIFFTSDTHFGEPYERFHLFRRNTIFASTKDYEDTVIMNWNNIVSKDDIIYIIGDYAVNEEAIERITPLLNGYKILIKGNYDMVFKNNFLKLYFNEIYEQDFAFHNENQIFYLQHFPEKALDNMFNLVGHIHDLWKVQRNMINVSTDAWHFFPVSLEEIIKTRHAITNFFDINVFSGELHQNYKYKQEDKKIIYPGSFDSSSTKNKSIFLAGPIMGALNWRKNLIYRLNKINKDFLIFNPQKIQKPEEYNLSVQVEWERSNMIRSSTNGVLIFWFANQETERESGSFAQTSRFEIGEFIKRKEENKELNIIVGFDTAFEHESYIKYKCEKLKIPIVYSFDDLVKEIEKIL